MAVKIKFYIGKGGLFSRLIRLKQGFIDEIRGNFFSVNDEKDLIGTPFYMASHVEIVFPGEFFLKNCDTKEIQNRDEF